MKNFKLLLATTAILSTGALLANAEDVLYYSSNVTLNGPSAKLKAVATLINSLEVKEIRPLSFGGIIKPEGGQKVVVSVDGSHDLGQTTAHVISSVFASSNANTTDAMLSLAPGEIEISGSYFADNGVNQQDSDVTAAPYFIFNEGTDVKHVPLKSGEILCGEVDFTPEGVKYGSAEMSSDFKKMTYKYGGILTLAEGIENNVPLNGSLNCEGSVTITSFGMAGAKTLTE